MCQYFIFSTDENQMVICIFLGPNNALHLLTYTTEDVTIGKHCNSGDCCHLNVTVRAGKVSFKCNYGQVRCHLNVTVWAGKVPFKKAWKTLMTSGSQLISVHQNW